MRVILLTVVLGLLRPVGAEAAGWVRIDTPNFVVYGESSEKRTREVAGEFERFREALGRVIPRAATRAAVPTIVVVFDTGKSFAPYRPTFNGKPVEVAGYFRGSDYENVVALTVDDQVNALRVIFHEYTHLAIANVGPDLPPWLSEGLAEFYSTFLVSPDGTRATLGLPIASHVQLLNTTRLIPLNELLSVTHESPMYNEGRRRSLFYAQSWALVHYLALEEPSHGAVLDRYVRAVMAGADPVAAWTTVSGPAGIIASLGRYAAQRQVHGMLYSFATGIDKASGVAERVSPSEIEAVFGDLLQWTTTQSLEADARLDRAAAMQPASGRAQALIGLLRARQSDAGDPRVPLMAAVADPDWLTQYYVATGLARLVDTTDPADRAQIVAAATRALDVVQSARPDMPHAFALRAEVAVRSDGDLATALQHIRRARTLAPGRDDYALLEAQILARQEAFRPARDVLGPLMSPASRPKTREQARSVMETVVAMERQAAARAERASQMKNGLDPVPNIPDPATARPIYRVMKTGEQRTEGLLERVECAARAITLHLRADGQLFRVTALGFEAVEFITYRDDLAGAVNCGSRVPPDHVYVTWTPLQGAPPSVLGRAVAVEFLSK